MVKSRSSNRKRRTVLEKPLNTSGTNSILIGREAEV